MKPKMIIRIVLVVAVLLSCMGLGGYSFWRLHMVEQLRTFNLYELVPDNATIIFEADDIANLLKSIGRENKLYVSELFSLLNKQSNGRLKEVLGGFDKRANRVLVSLHESDSCMHQVVYCELGTRDFERFNSFLNVEFGSNFSSREVIYKGTKMHILPLHDNLFMTMYLTPRFFVASLQKHLVECVIDAYCNEESLIHQDDFKLVYSDKYSNTGNLLYLRSEILNIEGKNEWVNRGKWTRFDVNWNEGKLCFSAPVSDKSLMYKNPVKQISINDFLINNLPNKMLSYSYVAIPNLNSFLNDVSACCTDSLVDSERPVVNGIDSGCLSLIDNYDTGYVVSLFFMSQDSLSADPCGVLIIPLWNEVEAERHLSLYSNQVMKRGTSRRLYLQRHDSPIDLYSLPYNVLMSYFLGREGIEKSICHVCFYKGCLLMSLDTDCIISYIQTIERGEICKGIGMEQRNGYLSSSCVYAMTMHMGAIARLSNKKMNILPRFFYKHLDFFSQFTWTVQYQYINNVLYENILLSCL